jgi:hypothetical protein
MTATAHDKKFPPPKPGDFDRVVTVERMGPVAGQVINTFPSVPALKIEHPDTPDSPCWHVRCKEAVLPPRKGDRIIDSLGTAWVVDSSTGATPAGRFIVQATLAPKA